MEIADSELYPEYRDVESGELFPTWRPSHRSDQRLLEAINSWLIGVVLFSFITGLMPLSLGFLIVFIVCAMNWLRSQHPPENFMTGQLDVPQTSMFNFRPNRLSLLNLRLSLLRREFNEADYDMLLALDDAPGARNLQRASDAQLRSLSKHTHRATKGLVGMDAKGGLSKEDDVVCTVCLESLVEGVQVTTLQCKHQFHSECLNPWLQQQGANATCPVCKSRVF